MNYLKYFTMLFGLLGGCALIHSPGVIQEQQQDNLSCGGGTNGHVTISIDSAPRCWEAFLQPNAAFHVDSVAQLTDIDGLKFSFSRGCAGGGSQGCLSCSVTVGGVGADVNPDVAGNDALVSILRSQPGPVVATDGLVPVRLASIGIVVGGDAGLCLGCTPGPSELRFFAADQTIFGAISSANVSFAAGDLVCPTAPPTDLCYSQTYDERNKLNATVTYPRDGRSTVSVDEGETKSLTAPIGYSMRAIRTTNETCSQTNADHCAPAGGCDTSNPTFAWVFWHQYLGV